MRTVNLSSSMSRVNCSGYGDLPTVAEASSEPWWTFDQQSVAACGDDGAGEGHEFVSAAWCVRMRGRLESVLMMGALVSVGAINAAAASGRFPDHVPEHHLPHDFRMANSLTYLGHIHWRDDKRAFGMHPPDRLAHMYVIGKTGTGKSSMLEFLVRQDLANGNGLVLFDPHGDLVER